MKIDDAINSSFSSPQQKAIVNIRITSNYLMHVQNSFVIHFGLRMPQFNILRILRGAKTEINVNAVKERMIERFPNTGIDKIFETNNSDQEADLLNNLLDKVRTNYE